MRLVQSTELRECGGQAKMYDRIVSVGLYRPSVPWDRLLLTAEVELCQARYIHPEVSHRIARTEAEGLDNVSLGFFGATNKEYFTKSDKAWARARFRSSTNACSAFSDRPLRRVGVDLDNAQAHMGGACLETDDRALSQLRFGRREGRRRISHKKKCAFDYVRARRSNERVDIVGIGGERAIEKAARPRQIVRGPSSIPASQTLKIEVRRVGVRGLFRTSRLGGDEFSVQCVR